MFEAIYLYNYILEAQLQRHCGDARAPLLQSQLVKYVLSNLNTMIVDQSDIEVFIEKVTYFRTFNHYNLSCNIIRCFISSFPFRCNKTNKNNAFLSLLTRHCSASIIV